MGDHQHKRVEESAVRIALWQQPEMRSKRLQAVDGDSAIEQSGCVQLQRLDMENTEMFVKARAPSAGRACT